MIAHALKAGKTYILRMHRADHPNSDMASSDFDINLEKLHLCIDADADGICDECNSVIEVELTLNQTKTVAYPEVNVCNPVYLKFTPNGSGEYFLTPAPMEAMQISLYASDKTTKLDFERMGADCVCTLEAGQTYYFKTNYIANNGVGEAEFTLICQHLTKTTVPAVTQPTCLIPAYNEHQVCTTCGEKFGYIETAPRLSHSGTPTYTWSDDNSTCTAEIACTNGDPHTETETVESVSVITQTASCESKELTRYTATFTNATFEQQIKENVETADSLGHDVSSEWSKDEMHHWHTCSRCDYTEGMAEHTFNEQNDCTICGAHVHYECGAVCTHEGEQAHANVAWQALPEDFIGGVLATGNYYLDRDIQLSAPITFNSDAVVNFCLNGYVLKAPTTGDNCSVFFIDSENGSQNVTLTVSDCDNTTHKFTPNTSGLWVLDEQNGTKTVTGGVITGGTGLFAENVRYGGAIYIYGNNTVNIYGGNVVGNTATQMGGAVYMNGGTDSVPTLNIYGSGFYGNVANVDGGAIYASAGTISTYHARFEANKTNISGGAIYTLGGYTSSNTTYINNIAKGSGAIWAKGTATVTNDTFKGNSATGDGAGAIYLDSGTLSIDSSNFIGNTATADGGAIYARIGMVNINNSHFEGNESTGGDAGAVYVVNSDTTLVSNNTTYTGNKAKKSGGAIFALTNATVIIKGGTFNKNKTTHQTNDGNGGAIGAWNGTNLTVKNADFTENEGLWGGAIRTNGANMIFIENSTFTGNKAVKYSATTGYGGALRIVGTSNATITGSTFTDNKSWRSGGAMSIESPITISDTTVTGNAAGRDGKVADAGGIRFIGIHAYSLKNVTIQNNSTTNGGRGGGVFNEKGTLTLGGKVVIDGNTLNGSANNLYTQNGATTKIGENGLLADSSIGYTLQTYTVNTSVVISSGANENDVGYFFADVTGKTNAGYYEEHENGKLILKNHSSHSYENGVCTLCKQAHTPHTYENGACSVCGFSHTPHEYENGVCKTCGIAHTPHTYTTTSETGATCDECGYVHSEHTYENGTCTVCGHTHADHSYENGSCTACGYKHTDHTITNDVCTVCGFKGQYHCVCGATEPHENTYEHISEKEYVALPVGFTGGALSGNYYFDRNVTLTTPITVTNGQELYLCLNGKVLTAPEGNHAIEINDGFITLCDCTETEHRFSVGSNGVWVLDEENGTNVIKGGVITGGNATNGGAILLASRDSRLEMYGANIVGNRATNGGAVFTKGHTFSIYGGQIIGNAASENGGGVYIEKDTNYYYASAYVFYIDGGAIMHNSAKNGGAVYAGERGRFTAEGTAKIMNNTASEQGGGVYLTYYGWFFDAVQITNNKKADGTANNVYFDDGMKDLRDTDRVSIFGDLTDGAKIGIASLGEFPAKSTSGEYFGKYIVSDYTNGVIKYSLTGVYDWEHRFCNVSTFSHVVFDTPFPDNYTGGYLDGGSYYLTKDVTLTEPIIVESYVTVNLCLCGHVLTAPDGGPAICFDESYVDCVFNLYDCTETEHKYRVDESGLWVLDEVNGTETVKGGVITGGKGSSNHYYQGGAVVLTPYSRFNMYGGNIIGNSASNGGGVSVYQGYDAPDTKPIFSMSGGSIMGNVATESGGGGVYVRNGAFTMSGGTIANNTAQYNGGGVCADSTFILNGGTITSNTAAVGGGVYGYTSSFTMNGGSITSNTATDGGGVYVFADGIPDGGGSNRFAMTGGTITGNSATNNGGGVYLPIIDESYFATLFVGGNPVICGNTVNGAENNVQSFDYVYIDEYNRLTDGAWIGIQKDFAGDITGTGPGYDCSEYFFSDNGFDVVLYDEIYYNISLVTPAENALSIDGDRIKAKNATEVVAVLVVASYDENDTLIDVKLIDVAPKTVARKTIAETGVNTQNAKTVKAMLLERLGTIKPLCGASVKAFE